MAGLKAEKAEPVHALQHEQIRVYGETVLRRFVDGNEWVLEGMGCDRTVSGASSWLKSTSSSRGAGSLIIIKLSYLVVRVNTPPKAEGGVAHLCLLRLLEEVWRLLRASSRDLCLLDC